MLLSENHQTLLEILQLNNGIIKSTSDVFLSVNDYFCQI